MLKKILLVCAFSVTSFSFGQEELFDFGGDNGVTPVSSYGLGQKGGAGIKNNDTNPSKTGINPSNTVIKYQKGIGATNQARIRFQAFSEHPPASGVNGTIDRLRYLSMKVFIPASRTSGGTISIGLAYGADLPTDSPVSSNTNTRTQSYLGTDAGTWVLFEFDFDGNALSTYNKLDVVADIDDTTALTAEEVYYIDDIQRYDVPASTKEFELFKNVSVFPNPTSGNISISDLKGAKIIYIVNVLGQTVKTMEASLSVDISDLVSGVYFLQTDNGLKRRIVKK